MRKRNERFEKESSRIANEAAEEVQRPVVLMLLAHIYNSLILYREMGGEGFQ